MELPFKARETLHKRKTVCVFFRVLSELTASSSFLGNCSVLAPEGEKFWVTQQAKFVKEKATRWVLEAQPRVVAPCRQTGGGGQRKVSGVPPGGGSMKEGRRAGSFMAFWGTAKNYIWLKWRVQKALTTRTEEHGRPGGMAGGAAPHVLTSSVCLLVSSSHWGLRKMVMVVKSCEGTEKRGQTQAITAADGQDLLSGTITPTACLEPLETAPMRG